MSDFEDVFGAGSDADYVINNYSRAATATRKRFIRYTPRCITRLSKKHQELKDTTRRLGFKWCLKHHVIDFPSYSNNAVFLDRVIEQRIYRLVIDDYYDQKNYHRGIRCIYLTKDGKKEAFFKADDWHSYDDVMFIAIDFKFGQESPLINVDSFTSGLRYKPLKPRRETSKRLQYVDQTSSIVS